MALFLVCRRERRLSHSLGRVDYYIVAKRFKIVPAIGAYTAEVLALREAFVHFLSFGGHSTVFFYTDCLSLLSAMSLLITKSEDVHDLKQLFRRLSNRLRVRLHHVRGHRGLFGNELADHFAVRASTVGTLRPVQRSKRVVRSILNAESWKRWSIEWTSMHCKTELIQWVPDVLRLPPDFPRLDKSFSNNGTREVPVLYSSDLPPSFIPVFLWSRVLEH